MPLSQLFTTSTITQLADLVAHSSVTKAVVPIKQMARPIAIQRDIRNQCTVD